MLGKTLCNTCYSQSKRCVLREWKDLQGCVANNAATAAANAAYCLLIRKGLMYLGIMGYKPSLWLIIHNSRVRFFLMSLVHVTFVLHGVGNNWSQHRDMHMSLEKPIDYSALEWQLLWRVQWC